MFKRYFPGFDWWIAGCALLLLAGSVFVMLTTGPGIDQRDAIWQSIYGAVGLVCFFLVARFDYRLIRRYTPALYVVMVALLILVHLTGTEIFGARRWIDLGVFQLQPSEVAKVIFVIILAKYFSGRSGRPSLKEMAHSLVYLLLPLALVVTQPDLGTALVFIAIWIVFLLAARVRWVHLAAMGSACLLLAPVIWDALRPYQQSRILTFLDPSRDPLGAGYNVTQAQIAVGSGGLWGRGVGHATQSNLSFLPVQHIDFIFAAWAEELGLIGVAALLTVFAALLTRTARAASSARDRFGMYLAVGVSAMLLFHVLVNVGMNVGLMPVTGIPLPLISYGGTSVVMTMVALGLIESIVMRSRSPR